MNTTHPTASAGELKGSRRRFLRGSSAALAGAAFAPVSFIHGSKGTATLLDGNNLRVGEGGTNWRSGGIEDRNPYQQEHRNLIASIRAGQPLDEAKNLAESTLTAIMGRESAHTGQTIEGEQALDSKLRCGPEKYALGEVPFPEVPMPGQLKFASTRPA